GWTATNSIFQEANIATTGDVLVDAGGDIVMSSGVSTQAGDALIAHAGGTISLGQLLAQRVSVEAGADLATANAPGTANVIAQEARLVAGGSIGDSDLINVPDANDNAIEIQVDTVAALAGSAIYLRQLAAGGDLTVGHVAATTVTVSANRIDENGATTVE